MANKKYFTDESLATLVDEIQAYANGSAATKADAALTSAKSYTDEKISTFVGDTPVATQIETAIDAIPQPDWNQNDIAAKDYIKNRPFYETTVYGDTLYWDGNTEGYETIELSEGEITMLFVRLSDVVPTLEEFSNGGSYVVADKTAEILGVSDNGRGSYTIHCVKDDGMEGSSPVLLYAEQTIGGITVPKGIYYPYVPDEPHMSSLTVNGFNGFERTEVVHIDPKYIKDMYYESEPVETVLVNNLTFEDYDNGNCPACNFIPGQKYKVIWNGEAYDNLVCYSDEGFNIIASEGLGCPFYIDDDGGDGLCIESDNGDETWIVSIIADLTEIHQIDPKYIKDIYAGLKVKGTVYTIDGEEVTAGVGAEIFNLYKKDIYGAENIASGDYSHAEGHGTTASGHNSHAEGYGTIASGEHSHAEGYETIASTWYSHAEGDRTIASGERSHAEGEGTIASGIGQHVQGRHNINDVDADGNPLNTYAHIVGNGEFDWTRSNAHTLDWLGNAWFAGDVYVGSTSGTNRDEGSKKLATTDDFDSYEFITVADIDEICGNMEFNDSLPQSDIDELMSQLQ